MTDRTSARPDPGPIGARGLRLFSVAGVRIVADWSVLIAFGLILVSLGKGVFPSWHPQWSAALSWSVALAAALLFFVSVLMHELSHAIVGQSVGIPMRQVTLFVFGGMAHMESEPPSPRSELLMASVGPLVSLALGVGATALGVWLTPGDLLQQAGRAADPSSLLAQLGPLPTLLLWLGPLNVVLGLFNLMPGFPLDGGRVLRALIWSATGDMRRATAWATAAGRVFAWLLIGVGVAMGFGLVLPVIGGGLFSGIWLVFVGWFLDNAARTSYQQMAIREWLAGVRVSDLMRREVVAVPPDITVATLVRDYMMPSEQGTFPVARGDQFVGMVSFADVHRVPRAHWETCRVAEIMVDGAALRTLGPDDDALDALQVLANPEHHQDQVPIVLEQHIEGMVRRRDIARWLSLHGPDERGAA